MLGFGVRASFKFRVRFRVKGYGASVRFRFRG